MSKYAQPMLDTVRRYLDMLAERDQKYWKNTDRYTYNFLENIVERIKEGNTNDYQLNREIGYLSRIMIERGYSSVSSERIWFKKNFWSLEDDGTQNDEIIVDIPAD